MRRGIEQLSFPAHEIEKTIPISWVVFVKMENPLNPQVLISERISGGYTFPGGKKEKHQSFRETAIDEGNQETGLYVFEDELVELSRQIKFGVGSDSYIAQPYVFFMDEFDIDEPITREPEKHKGWEWMSISRIASLVNIGEFSYPVWENNEWLDLIKEAAFEEWLSPHVSERLDLPAWFMEDCHQYMIRGMYKKFEKLYLKDLKKNKKI